MEYIEPVADSDCGDDYQVSDGGVDKYMMMIPLIMTMMV